MNIHAVLRECATDLLDTEPNVTVNSVVSCAYRRHGDAFVEAQQALVRQAATTIVRNLMRDLTSDDESPQLSLPGLDLPSAIAVQTDTGTYYVRSDKATWSELEAGEDVRAGNVAAAQSKLDTYRESMELLRPFMEGNPSVTVADAVRAMSKDAA